MESIYYCGNNTNTVFSIFTNEAEPLIKQVELKFPLVKLQDCFAISNPTFHEILNEPIISTCLGLSVTKNLIGNNYVFCSRKYCMESGTSFIRGYTPWVDSTPEFLPSGCKPLFKGVNFAEYNKPAPANIDTFFDIYFSGDPSIVEQSFNLPQHRGTYETFYGITIMNSIPVRIKQYAYDKQSGFSDWDVIWFAYNKWTKNNVVTPPEGM
jgi:hypothetical protein